MNHNILFIRLRLLGDIIFTIPSIRLYNKHFPQSSIYYVVEEAFKEVTELLPGIQRRIVVPRKMGIRDLYRFRQEVRAVGFDTVIDFHCGPKAALLTYLSGAKIRIGYRTPNRNWAYNRLTPRMTGSGPDHSVYNQARLLEHLGIDSQEMLPYPEIKISPDRVSPEIRQWPEQHRQPKIVVHVGAGNTFRDWGLDNFGSLIQKLTRQGCAVALIGSSAAEQHKAASLTRDYPVRNFTGRLSIKEVLYLIGQGDVYFGVDSGPLHLASLTATPIVAIYGPNIPRISGPWRQRDVKILQLDMECRPCSQRECIYDTIRCMKNITAEDAYENIIRYIQ